MPEKFDLLKGQLLDSGIFTADILKVLFFLAVKYFNALLTVPTIYLSFAFDSGCYISDISQNRGKKKSPNLMN
jgi:hypothetical protein